MLITIQWHANLVISILNIYAPNFPTKNGQFWEKVKTQLITWRIPKPDSMIGDFNIVEDGINRLPCRHDNVLATEKLQELRNHLSLIDGWRTLSPNFKAYTHTQKPMMTKVRLDQRYATQRIVNTSLDWEIEESGIETHHELISVIVTNPVAPFIGKGR